MLKKQEVFDRRQEVSWEGVASYSLNVRLAQMSDVSRGRASYALTVADTGMGMAPEFTLHLFEAFERERRLAVGMDAYIAKPLDVDVAFSTLASVLDSPAKKWSPEALGPRATGKDARVKRALPS